MSFTFETIFGEYTLQYFSVPHWFTNNENISVKGKKFEIQMLSVIWIRFAGYSKSKECSKSKYVLRMF